MSKNGYIRPTYLMTTYVIVKEQIQNYRAEQMRQQNKERSTRPDITDKLK